MSTINIKAYETKIHIPGEIKTTVTFYLVSNMPVTNQTMHTELNKLINKPGLVMYTELSQLISKPDYAH